MNKLLFALLFTNILFSQTKITTKCLAEISCSQKFGTTITKREYTLKVIFDNKQIKFSTYDNTSDKGMNTYDITKQTNILLR